MDDNVEDCPVCLSTFDDALRRPRNLPCGHTLCTLCINELKESGAVNCPTCQVSHALPEAGQFPISYITEGFIRKMKGLVSVPTKPGKQLTALASVTQSVGLGRKIQSLLKEQEAKVLAAICSCQEEQSQLTDYLTTLGGWGGRQQRLEDELQALSKGTREAVHREESRVESRKEEVRRREKALHAVLQALRTPVTQQEAYEVIEKADHLLEGNEESDRKEERLSMFPDVQVVTTVARVAEASRAALQAASTQTGLEATGTAAVYSTLPTAYAAASSIAKRLEVLLPPLPSQSLTAKDLLSMRQAIRGQVETGLVFAVQDMEGQSRYARISLEHGRLHLYSLQAMAPPPSPRVITLQMEEVVPVAPPCEVFLDLEWPGSAARRVVVSLPRDTPRARQFVLLCSGQRGACYANTWLFRVRCEGQPGEYVMGGDYQIGDGTGGAALLPDLDKVKYRESGKAGAVWWGWYGPASAALFRITTRDWKGGYAGVFGEVVQGLQAVKEAAQHRPITEVTVVQCGVLLSR